MGKQRPWCKYLVKKGNKILDGGITQELLLVITLAVIVTAFWEIVEEAVE